MDRKNIEDIYPISEVQRAFLFQSLRLPDQDPNILLLRITLHANLDKEEVASAWRQVAERHGLLRSSVHWEGAKRPMLVVHRRAEPTIKYVDFSSYAAENQLEQIRQLIEAQRRVGFQLNSAPLSRLHLIQLGRERQMLLWVCHHLLLDGWSAAIVIRELLHAWNGATNTLPPAPKFRDHIAWLSQQDRDAARTYWRDELSDLTPERCLLVSDHRDPGADTAKPQWDDVLFRIDAKLTTSLSNVSARQGVTLGTILATAWAIALRPPEQAGAVLVGVTTSGRSSTVHGIEHAVGAFMNVVPLRIDLDSQLRLLDAAQRVHRCVQSRLPHEFTALGEVLAWDCLSGFPRPFDAVIVFENYPWDIDESFSEDNSAESRAVRLLAFEGDVASNAPFTLIVIPGPQLELRIRYRSDLISSAQAKRTLSATVDALRAFIQDSAQTVGEMSYGWERSRGQGDSRSAAAVLDTRSESTVESERILVLERRLTRIWCDVLGLPGVGRDQPFFNIGGTSLSGLVVLDRIENELGVKLPLVAIFQAPTVNELARLIERQKEEPEWTWLTRVLPGGAKPPVFLMNCGNIMVSKIGDAIDPRHPVYLVNGHWDRANIELTTTVEEIVNDYLAEMLLAQPSGPYILGGYSMGAVFAYHAALQLREQGAGVPLLFLLDPPEYQLTLASSGEPDDGKTPFRESESPRRSNGRDGGAFDRFGRRLSHAGGIRNSHRIVARRLVRTWQDTTNRIRYPLARFYRTFGWQIPPAFRSRFVFHCYSRALRRYELKEYGGPMLIFRTVEEHNTGVWLNAARGPVEVHEFKGTHLEFLRGNNLVEQWTKEFAEAVACMPAELGADSETVAKARHPRPAR